MEMRFRMSLKKKLERFYYIYLKDKKYYLILGGLIIFVLAGSVFCVKQDRYRQEQEKIQAELEAEKKAEEAKKKAEEKRKESNSLQPGVPVGVYEQGDEKIVYLTFDDGPSENTKKVLEILEKYDAKATFFVTGANEKCRSYIKSAYDAGHTIGLHTYTHAYDKVYASEEAYFSDLENVGNMVKEEIGFVPCFIRFPGGASNTISRKYCQGIMSVLTAEVLEKGYQYYDWNWDSGDGGNPNTEQIYQNAIGSDLNEIILLFHDSEPKDSTVEALPRIIEYYKERGYEFKAISRDSFVAHHNVNN